MTIYRLPRKFFALMIFIAAAPLTLGIAFFLFIFGVLYTQSSLQSLGAGAALIIVNGLVFIGGGLSAFYYALCKVTLQVEVGKDTVSFYAALRVTAISPAEIRSVNVVPEGSVRPIGAVVHYTGGKVYLLSKTMHFEELIRELTPAVRTGFVRS